MSGWLGHGKPESAARTGNKGGKWFTLGERGVRSSRRTEHGAEGMGKWQAEKRMAHGGGAAGVAVAGLTMLAGAVFCGL